MAGPAVLPTSGDPLGATLCKAGITLPYALREYQWQGVRFLCEQDAALLADEMGLGKTVQAGVAIRLLLAEGRSRRILIACPASLTINWQNELHAWAPGVSVRRVRGDSADRKAHFHLPFQVWLASYEQVRADIDLLRKGSPYDLVVLDLKPANLNGFVTMKS